MKSAIVILNYNDADTAAKLINQVKEYDTPDYIVVVDNKSSDDSFAVLSQYSSDRIRVIQAPENGGYAKGNNYGIKYAIEEFSPDCIFVANPDVSVSRDTFVNIQNAFSSYEGTNDKAGIIAPIVNQGANVWNLPGFIGMVESLFLIWFNIDKRLIKKKLIASDKLIEKVGVVEGSFFCISREAYEKIQGLDENTFLYVEENILGKRLNDAGYSVNILTKERYDHFHSVSIKKRFKSSKAKAFHLFYDSMTYYNKAYLKTGPIRNGIFNICYGLAYVERVIYDLLMNLSGKR